MERNGQDLLEQYVVILSLGESECSKCYIVLPQGAGIMLKTCHHTFCRECLKDLIMASSECQILCPYKAADDADGDAIDEGATADSTLGCHLNGYITRQEIRAILPVEEQENYFRRSGHIGLDEVTPGFSLWQSTHEFDCPICLDVIQVGDGIILQECLHTICRNCIVTHISNAEDATVECPFTDGSLPCDAPIGHAEIKALVPKDVYDKITEHSAKLATANLFCCVTPNCRGWCDADTATALVFTCPICGRENCLRCNDIHENLTCDQYWQCFEDCRDRTGMTLEARNEKMGEGFIKARIQSREYRQCPGCQAVCVKIDGCDHVTCASCKIPFNW